MVARSQRIWGAWVAACVASFAVLEAVAYRRGCFLTLSRCLARWMGLHPRTWWGHVGPWLFLAAWTALTVHVMKLKHQDQP